MEKLELKHLAPYMPYNLGCYLQGHKDEDDRPIKETILGLYDETETEVYVSLNEFDYETYIIFDVFPILRPLSDLTKEIEHNGEKFIPIKYLQNNYSCFGFDYNNEEGFVLNTDVVNYKYLPYMILYKLFEWHFDVFNLRENDLCIYYNEL